MTELFCTIALFTVTRTTPDMSAVKLLQRQLISLAEIGDLRQLRIENIGILEAIDSYSRDITACCSHGLSPPPLSTTSGYQ